MITTFIKLNAGIRFFRNNRKKYLPGWAEVNIYFDLDFKKFFRRRHYQSLPIPKTWGIPVHDKKYEIADNKWNVRTFIFLVETKFFNDKPKTRYDWEQSKDVTDWEFCTTAESAPTDRCQMYTTTISLPFVSIETTYKTEYGVQKDRELDEYFDENFGNKKDNQ